MNLFLLNSPLLEVLDCVNHSPSSDNSSFAFIALRKSEDSDIALTDHVRVHIVTRDIVSDCESSRNCSFGFLNCDITP